MVNYHALQPGPLHMLQMNQPSLLYKHFLDLLKKHPKHLAVELVKEYCLNNEPRDVEEQIAYLEFLYMNDFINDLKEVISTNRYDKEVISLYRVLVNRSDYSFFPQSVLQLESLQFSHPFLQCLHKFMVIYCYMDIRNYKILDRFIDECDKALQYISEPLVHYYFQSRYNELLFHHYWKTDNTLLARRYAYKILNKELSMKRNCMIHHHLALTFVFESYERAMDEAHIALELAVENQWEDHVESLKERTIPFIAAFHEKVDMIETPDVVETAHIAIAEKNWNRAIAILKNLDSLTPFQECYLGLALKDKEMLYRSRERFIEEYGDQFFAHLPEFYLKRL